MARTWSPASTSSRQMFDPIRPVPPVTRYVAIRSSLLGYPHQAMSSRLTHDPRQPIVAVTLRLPCHSRIDEHLKSVRGPGVDVQLGGNSRLIESKPVVDGLNQAGVATEMHVYPGAPH